MKRFMYAVLLVLSWPALVIGWLYVGLCLITFLADSVGFDRKSFVLYAIWRPWIDDKWKRSLTVGRGIVFTNIDVHWRHEYIHVKQGTDFAICSFIYSVIATVCAKAGADPWALGLALWVMSPSLMLVPYLTAWLRGSIDVAREAETEAAAYAQDKTDH